MNFEPHAIRLTGAEIIDRNAEESRWNKISKIELVVVVSRLTQSQLPTAEHFISRPLQSGRAATVLQARPPEDDRNIETTAL
jgi:hypothetical protein